MFMRDLRSVRFDPEYTPGAVNAINVCLRVEPSEKVTIITDEACLEIAASLVAELDRLGAPHNDFVLEDIAARPMSDMPQPILDDMETSQVSIYAVVAQRNELKT